MALKAEPERAREMACRIAHVVKTLVDRPKQEAIVKGLNRKLYRPVSAEMCSLHLRQAQGETERTQRLRRDQWLVFLVVGM